MELSRARDILKHPTGVSQRDWQRAVAVDMRNRETSQQAVARLARDFRAAQRPNYTADARLRDQPAERDLPRAWGPSRVETIAPSLRSGPPTMRGRIGSETDEIGAILQLTDPPSGSAAPQLVMELSGDLSGYILQVNPRTQRPALFYYPPVEADRGVGSTGGGVGPIRSGDTRDRSYYQALARQSNTARELAGVALKTINAQNASAWANRRG